MERVIFSVLAVAASVAHAATCDALPAILIVQDRSFSMSRTIAGDDVPTVSNPSKWTISQQVIPQLAFDFENRIRFGVMLYPTANEECGTGTVVSPISNTASHVHDAYLAPTSVPSGLTPTAASLDAARNHLEGLNLTTPKYVLLITDGIPNCIGPDPDAATVDAARRLKDAGILVGVVGFGAQFAGGNDKAVLDRIAEAGGTGSAYIATNREQLASQLNFIAASAATCCRDACSVGAAQCSASGQRQTCQINAADGCTQWVSTVCPVGSVCANGLCTSCTDACSEGAVRCAGKNAQSCVRQDNGCTDWANGVECAADAQCIEGGCRERCPEDELSHCPAGTACRLVGVDRLCMPEVDAGVVVDEPDDERTTPSNPDAGLVDRTSGREARNLGAGGACSSGLGGLSWWVLAMAVVVIHARFRR